jgi:hypothetical protein
MAPSRSCPPQCRCGLAVAPSLSFVVVRPRRWLSQSNGKTSMETSRTVRGVLDATRVARGNVVTVSLRLRRALGPAQRGKPRLPREGLSASRPECGLDTFLPFSNQLALISSVGGVLNTPAVTRLAQCAHSGAVDCGRAEPEALLGRDRVGTTQCPVRESCDPSGAVRSVLSCLRVTTNQAPGRGAGDLNLSGPWRRYRRPKAFSTACSLLRPGELRLV